MSAVSSILWSALLVATLCVASDTSSIPMSDANSPKSDSKVNAVEILNEAEDLERIGAVESYLPVEVARTIRRISRYLLAEADNILNALDDVLFCINMARGQLAQLRAESESYGGTEVEQLVMEAEADLEQVQQILSANFKYSPNFKKNFSFTRTGIQAENIRRLDPRFTIPNFNVTWDKAFQNNLALQGSVTEFTPDASDVCMSQIQPRTFPGQAQVFSGRPSYCPVDAPCWLMTTRPGTQGYYLTHQLLFLLLGENGGCALDFEAQVRRYFGDLLPADAGDVTPEIMRHQCRDVLVDANLIADAEYPDIFKDLFVEQGFLCGTAVNMPEFFSSEWLRTAMSWQLPSGCYGFVNPSGLGIDYRSMEKEENFKRTWERNDEVFEKSPVEDPIEEQRLRLRSKAKVAPTPRREQVMSGSCYAHYTVVALGYFAVALRYLLE